MSSSHPRIPVLETAFNEMSRDVVDLGGPLTEKGRSLAKQVVAKIEDAAVGSPGCPTLYPDQSFIAGSLGRRTQERPLDDVDVYLVLQAPHLTAVDNGMSLPLVSQYSNPNTPLITDASLKESGYISADAVLNRFVGWLPTWFPHADVGKGKAGKTAYVKREGVNIDLCPVLWCKSTISGIDQYWMPQGNSFSWKATNPKEDQRFMTEANQNHDGDLLRIVRMMKWWNVKFNGDRLKGIHLETMIVNALSGKAISSWASTLHYLFGVLSDQVQQPCIDPTGLGDPLDSSLSSDDRSLSHDNLLASWAIAQQAKDWAAAGDVAECLRRWRAIFSDLPLMATSATVGRA